MAFVCVQPAMTAWARRAEDLTSDRTDDKDAVLIARLTAQLRCYVPEPVDETWGRLRHLGARRRELVVDMTAQIQQIRALLECVWPAALETARQPFRSRTWIAALQVICGRDGADFGRTRRLGLARLERLTTAEVTRAGGQRPCLRIARKLFAALDDRAGVLGHRCGALERIELLLGDWADNKRRLADTEARMVGISKRTSGVRTACPTGPRRRSPASVCAGCATADFRHRQRATTATSPSRSLCTTCLGYAR
ncbi:IS110 family transposase [Nocardia sp. NEAU-G5]|uniref:IS110 family transposase n=1 Tax=Nocardia albiluteola TaxID=2842303 RepID=A0ABS6BCT5_9NOCA|nr:IS110 family transposase [Nocardia albiluteola]